MRLLNRAACHAPACLAAYDQGTDSWADVLPEHREEIRACLESLQGRRCAYCEGDLEVLGQHIEHLRSRHRHPAQVFEWNNLYWSCYQEDSCGRFKDLRAGSYDVADLIDPCLDDPDEFFIFRSDGTIGIRRGLSMNQERRAVETLRVFSLDADWGRLRAMRRAAVSGYVKSAEEALEAGLSAGEIRAYFSNELEYARDLPFCTAIRHVLTEAP